jgi:hypothetical protein
MKLDDLETVTELDALLFDLTKLRDDCTSPHATEPLDDAIESTKNKLRGLGVILPGDKPQEVTLDTFVNVVVPRSRAIIVADGLAADALRPVFPDCKVFPIGGALTGHRFDVIVIAAFWKNEQEHRWFEENLATRLKPGGKLIWLT